MAEDAFLYDDVVALVALRDEDVPAMTRWINDQAVLHYLDVLGGLSCEQEQEWLRRLRGSTTERVLGIVRRADGKLVGNTGLHGISAINAQAEFGIMLGERESWGQGLGTAAGRLILDYGFNRLNLHRIYLRVMAYNQRGVRSYERLGFQHEGRLRQHIWREGAYHDLQWMGLLREEFNARWAEWREQQRLRYGCGT